MKRWTNIFKIFSNINRVKIIKLLTDKRTMMVGDIARELDISFASTSKHLIMLDRLDILNSKGVSGHVFYELNRNMPKDVRRIINIFI